MVSRRQVLKIGAASVPAGVGLAGCLGTITGDDPPTETPTETPLETNMENLDPVSAETFETWEPDTNCNDGEMEEMYNSEISVQGVVERQSASYTVIAYADLPDGEKQILAEALETGGYATCEPAGAFRSFVERAYAKAQEGDSSDRSVFLEYDGDYYRLYIRQADEVFTY